MPRQITSDNAYREKLIKLIPGEIVGAYVALHGFLSPYKDRVSIFTFWTVLAILTLFTPLYLRRLYKVLDNKQIACTTGSFLVWSYSLGGPFQMVKLYDGRIASALLILWTLFIPLVMVRKSDICRGDWVTIVPKRPTKSAERNFSLEWIKEMSEFCSQRAQVVSVDAQNRTARLDVDKGENEWAFEWLILVSD